MWAMTDFRAENGAARLSPELLLVLGYKMNGALGFHDPRVRAGSLVPRRGRHRRPIGVLERFVRRT